MGDKRVKKKTLETYEKALQRLLTFIRIRGVIIADYPALDRILQEYGERVAESTGEFSTVLAATQFFFPGAKGNTPVAFQLKRGMSAAAEVRHTVPLVEELMWGSVDALMKRGDTRVALGLLTQFSAYLRVHELVQLTRKDVCLPEQNLTGGCFLILGVRTHGTKVGREQTVEITNLWAIAGLRFLCRNTSEANHLLSNSPEPMTAGEYSRILRQSWADMHVDDLGLTPHSPRAGGATNDLLNRVPFVSVQEKGRWLHAASARVYLDRAQALALKTQRAATRFRTLAKNPRNIGNIFAFR